VVFIYKKTPLHCGLLLYMHSLFSHKMQHNEHDREQTDDRKQNSRKYTPNSINYIC